ncbi:hypothetical protein [Lysinibacillus telephonicus]|uniref:hypothetical protein n=1 Tax=Lysinibacillus telephonicus TaxID=1714840 RepID=UPI003B9F8EE2
MYVFAQLDEQGKVVAVTYPASELIGESVIDISQHENPDSLLGATFDGEKFNIPNPIQPKEQPTVEELIFVETTYQIALLEVMSLG